MTSCPHHCALFPRGDSRTESRASANSMGGSRISIFHAVTLISRPSTVKPREGAGGAPHGFSHPVTPGVTGPALGVINLLMGKLIYHCNE